jgi:hypothetical protein
MPQANRRGDEKKNGWPSRLARWWARFGENPCLWVRALNFSARWCRDGPSPTTSGTHRFVSLTTPLVQRQWQQQRNALLHQRLLLFRCSHDCCDVPWSRI